MPAQSCGPAWLDAMIERGEVVLLDGATGTELQRRGVPMHDKAWSGTAMAEHGDTIRRLHEDYIRAGARVITANTFSAGRHSLEPAGHGDQVAAVNRRAVALAREARDEAAVEPVAIAGSVCEWVYDKGSRFTDPSVLAESFKEQCGVLAEAGVDLINVEMCQRLPDSALAVDAAVATGLPVWAGVSCRQVAGRPVQTFDEDTRGDLEPLVEGLTGRGVGTTELDVTGAGTLSIGTSSTPTNAIFQIGNGATTNVGNAGILDMSGLANFYANLGTGLFRVGSPTNSGSANGGASMVILAANSTIQAATLFLGGPDGAVNSGPTAVQSLKLGSGTNVINVDTLNLGGLGAADGQSNGSITFNDITGTLKIRGQADPVNGRAALNIGVRIMDTGVAALSHLFDTTGHSADLMFGTMTIGSRTTSGTFTGNVTAEFRFDTGTLNASDLIIGSRGGTTAVASTGAGIVSLGGGTVTINTTTAPILLGVNTIAAGNGTGTLNISGGTVSVLANAGTSIRIADATVAGGTATGTLNLARGTLTVAGDILRGANTGTSNATVKLSGGTLNMNGHDLGAAGGGALTFTVESGTLQNIASINGSGGLTKTTTGTLTLSGANNYIGPTTISAGTLALGANNVLPATALSIGNATLNAATFTDTVGTLNVTGTSVINLGSGATLAFADSSAIDWTGGTLTITGTFVSGSSLRFGTTGSGLTATQLSRISKPGGGAVALNASGYLIDAPVNNYASWASTNAPGSTPGEDYDGDGVSNAVEYVLGGSALTDDMSKLPAISTSGENMLFTFQRAQASINVSTALSIQVGTTLLAWPDTYTVGADTATSSAGVTVQTNVPAGFDTITLSIPQAPDLRKFIRLNVTVTP